MMLRLEMSSSGLLDDLQWVPNERILPQSGEVEVQVKAVGLNFREVMKALGMYPEPLEEPFTFGGDCVGTVVAVGEGVKQFQVGEEVLGFVPLSFSSFITIPAHLVIHKPGGITRAEAATIPATFMTAYYALHHLAHLRAGERVLIHAAAGGVGLAAIQISQWLNAEIHATAGTPEKRAYLHSLGIQNVMNSRTLEFADQIMELTCGKGVDVILNSLAKEFIPKGLSIMAVLGRFLELGKQDIYNNSSIGLSPFRNNVSFFAIDLEQLWKERPLFTANLLQDLMKHFEDGILKPLPYKTFSMQEVKDAFRYMRKAKHIGRIVITLQEEHYGC